MNGTQTRAVRPWGHVREHVLAGAALQLLNGEDPSFDAATQRHLTHCERCVARLEALRGVLAGERQGGMDAADAAFPESRLDAQRASILDRLARDRAKARVLAFPTTGSWMSRRDRPAMRWLAAAAAAGLLIGLGAGQIVFTGQRLHINSTFGKARTFATRDWTPVLWHSAPGKRQAQPAGADRDEPRVERLSPAAEEAFLSEVEFALNNRRVAALRALDDLTPRAHDTPRRRK
jgi:hypothetical protein